MINLEYFKDKIFDLLNEENTMDIQDIETNDKENTFQIFFEDGSAFEIECLNKQLYFAEKTGIENIIQKSKKCLKFRTI